VRAERETRQSIVSRRTREGLFVYWFTVDRHAHRGLAMTRGMVSTMKEVKKLEFSYCHCEEGAERETRQSIVSRRTREGLSVRLLAHSGSPRAFSPRDDKSGGISDEKRVRKGTVRAFISLFTLQSSLFLHWLFWKPIRKPRWLMRCSGPTLLRLAERRWVSEVNQEPPRRTRSEPEPPELVGLITGLPEG